MGKTIAIGRPVACAFCGKVRSKKRDVEIDGHRYQVCESHVCKPDGSLSNQVTIEAASRIWWQKSRT